MKKTLAIAGVGAMVALTSVTGLGVAHAATSNNTNSSSGPMSSLVNAIASKFNLKTADVQAVFDAQHAQKEAQETADVKAKVSQLVSDGKLTQTQATALLAKRAELQQQRDANRSTMHSMTDAERKAAIDKEKTALDTWFSEQGISTDYRYLVRGGPHGHDGPDGPPPSSNSPSANASPSGSSN